MTEIKLYCDICGKEITQKIVLSLSDNPKIEMKEEGEKCTTLFTPKLEHDLCDKCYKDIVIFLHSKLCG